MFNECEYSREIHTTDIENDNCNEKKDKLLI